MKKKKAILIFSGYNQRAVIAFLRTLEKNSIEEYYIFACSEEDTILKTGYQEKVFAVRKNRQLDLDEICSLIRQAKKYGDFDTFCIPPSTEALNRFILEHLTDLETLGLENVLVEKALYETISEKELFSALCLSHHLLIPEKIVFPKQFAQKFVAKPKRYYSESGKVYNPVLITCETDYDRFVNTFPKNDFFYQPFVEGRSIYLLYYITRSGETYRFSQENLIQQPGGKSIVCAKSSTFHRESIADAYEHMFLQINYHGFVMVEIRLCGEKFYMIEANPRFWGPSQLFVDARYNFFEAFLKEYGFLNSINLAEPNNEIHYYWNGGLASEKREKPVFFNGFQSAFDSTAYIRYDIYNRPDTKQLYTDGD